MSLARRSLLLLCILTVLLVPAAQALAQPLKEHVPDRVLIKFRTNATEAEKAAIMADLGAVKVKELKRIKTDVDRISGVSVEEAINRYKNHFSVEFIEPDYVLQADEIPNDPMFNQLWGMRNTGQTGGTAGADIMAENAWDVFSGSRDVVIGVIDTGVDYNHPDLAANMYTNPGEIAGNGIDDDANGKIDDVRGWDFINEDNDPMDDNGHGTHCSGTIGGVGNNGVGVAGVCWRVKIMPLKFLNASGSGSLSDAVEAITYATQMGVRLTSNSWGGGGISAAMQAAIADADAHGILFVAAAGNAGTNNDTSPHYPSSYDNPNVVAVAATDHNDALASFSCWGPTSVDLAAPGVDILSSLPGSSYGTYSGTSMATPHVSGAFGLMFGRFPAISHLSAKSLLLNFVDPVPALAGKMVTGGRLNVFFPIADPDDTPPGQVTNLAIGEAGSNWLRLNWTATGDDGNVGKASRYDIRWSTSPIDAANFESATRVLNPPNPDPFGTPQTHKVSGLAFSSVYYFALKALDEFGNAGPVSNLASGSTLGIPDLAVAPASLSESLVTGGTAVQTLTLENVGEGTLDFAVSAPLLGGPTVVLTDYVERGKDEVDPNPGILGAGGPDVFGYRWYDSDDPLGPPFAWQDISGTGTVALSTGDDSSAGPFPISFAFPFYGEDVNQFWVTTNGTLSFSSNASPYSNAQLPSPGAPGHLIAPFWDDLNLTSAGDVYWQDFGDRIVVQWHQVPNYSSGGPYTFQVILHSDGAIEYQYLTMGSATTSATVGLQNGTGTDGLTVAYNASYLHDNLAIRFRAMPQWMSVTPTSGTAYPGGPVTLSVAFDASGLLGGDYQGAVRILSNDPDEADYQVPVTLHVTGAPDLVVSPASLDFGAHFIGATPTLNVLLNNEGTDFVNVTGLATSDGAFTLSLAAPVAIGPRAAETLAVTFSPALAQMYAGTLTVTSDDPDMPVQTVALGGEGLVPPDFAITPTSLSSDLMTGEVESQTLRITNSGGANFTFSLAVDTEAQVTVHDEVLLDKEELDLRVGEPVIDGAGGPDLYGYTWIDSDEPGGPTFSWIDISGTGTPVFTARADDLNRGPFPIGFTFPFYGNTFDTFRLCSNGWISFTSSLTQRTNQLLPNSGASIPENLLAAFWDDLDVYYTDGGQVYYQHIDGKLVVQYKHVRRYGTTTYQDFEIVLYPNGTILYQYLGVAGTLNSATVGLQNAARNDGLTVAFNTNYLHNNLAIKFAAAPEWLSVNPTSGTVPPGGSLNLTALFNADGLYGGDYHGSVDFTTNDPAALGYSVPALLHVTGAPDIVLSTDAIDFGNVMIGYPTIRQMTVLNNGTDNLVITSVAADNGDYLTNFTPPVSLAPMTQLLLDVRFAPSVAGAIPATLTFQSNDPDHPATTVSLLGAGLVPPVAGVTPTQVAADLFTGQQAVQTVVLSNTGGSDLDWTAQTVLTYGADVVQSDEVVELGKDDADPRVGILGSGGPDIFGYRWIDSDEPGGPSFNWVDISGTGTPIFTADSDDVNRGPFPIGFSFPFYGTPFTEFRLGTNGFLSFTSTATALTNYALPNSGSGAPENLLAAFWDDLDVETSDGAQVFYQNVDGKLVVQYNHVERYGTAFYYTFQVILFPNGTILYQYLTMPGDRQDEATIGIQNATKDDGLTVVYNADYVHDNLAIRLGPMPQWITPTPATGTVPPGGSVPINVTFDATGMYGGNYVGAVQITSNDPGPGGLLEVLANLHVTGVPLIAVEPAALDFGPLFIGLTAQRTFTVRNTGTDVLQISAVSCTRTDYTYDLVPCSIQPTESVDVTVTFVPAVAGDCNGELQIANNTGTPLVSVPLTGVAVLPPDVDVSPTSFEVAVMPGASRTKILTVCNTGASPLTFNAAPIEATAIDNSSIELGKEDLDSRPGILGAGGPDAFGYSWADSDEPGGPVFNWVDISTTGTPLFTSDSDDALRGPLPIGFTFPFYGNDFTAFKLSTNGWLSFSYTGTSSALTNYSLPNSSSSAPENLLAAFWDDLDVETSDGAQVYYQTIGDKLIVQYNHVERYSTSFYYTFQVILERNGTITYQYLTMPGDRVDEATIGIQNATKSDGLTVVFNANYVHDNLAVRLRARAPWLTIDPLSGTVPPGECMNLTVTFDAAELEAGDYTGSLALATNDPDESLVSVPVLLHVGLLDAAWADFDPNTLNAQSNGRTIAGYVELPAGYAAADIDVASVTFLNQVPADQRIYSLTEDTNLNGVADAMFKFSRPLVEPILPDGDDVPVYMFLEVTNQMWFVARDTIRVIRPHLTYPLGGEVTWPGATLSVAWTDPDGWTVASADLLFSPDDGATWTPIATGLTGNQHTWTVPAVESAQARVRVTVYDADGAMGYDTCDQAFTVTSGPTGVDQPALPTVFALRTAVPNPFNPMTMIQYDLPTSAKTSLSVYDVRGRLVRTLVAQEMPAGFHKVVWDGKTDAGKQVPSGVYFYRIVAGDFRDGQRMVLVK